MLTNFSVKVKYVETSWPQNSADGRKLHKILNFPLDFQTKLAALQVCLISVPREITHNFHIFL